MLLGAGAGTGAAGMALVMEGRGGASEPSWLPQCCAFGLSSTCTREAARKIRPGQALRDWGAAHIPVPGVLPVRWPLAQM